MKTPSLPILIVAQALALEQTSCGGKKHQNVDSLWICDMWPIFATVNITTAFIIRHPHFILCIIFSPWATLSSSFFRKSFQEAAAKLRIRISVQSRETACSLMRVACRLLGLKACSHLRLTLMRLHLGTLRCKRRTQIGQVLLVLDEQCHISVL